MGMEECCDGGEGGRELGLRSILRGRVYSITELWLYTDDYIYTAGKEIHERNDA